jgi:hypothetical protein
MSSCTPDNENESPTAVMLSESEASAFSDAERESRFFGPASE